MLNNKFLINILTLISGTTIAQLIVLFFSPILTRLYEPSDFGVFTLYTSIVGILSVVISLRYELAILLPSKNKDAINIVVLSILINFIITFLTFIVVLFFRNQIADLLNSPSLSSWLWLLPLSLLLTGVYQTISFWSTRKKSFKLLAKGQVTQNSITPSFQSLSGTLFSNGLMGLIGGKIVGQISSIIILLSEELKMRNRKILKLVNRELIIQNFIRYRDFLKYSVLSGVFNSSSTLMTPVLLGVFYSPTIVGYYYLSNRILKMPINVIGDAVSKVFFQKASNSRQEISDITFKIFRNLLSLSFLPMIVLIVIAPELISFIFGDNWYQAGIYMQVLAPWLLIVFISAPLSTLYVVLERQKVELFLNIIIFNSRLSVFVIGGFLGSPIFTLSLYSTVSAILWLINTMYIMVLANVKIKFIIREFFYQIIYSIPFILIMYLVLYHNGSDLLQFSLAITLVLIHFTLQYHKLKRTFNNDFS